MTEDPTSWLSSLTSLYTPLASHFDAAKSHRDSIEARLDASLGVFRMFEIGSLRHGTGVWTFSDADYLVSLKGTRPDSSISLLEKVKASLQVRFPTTPITIRRPAVVCHFSDCIFEVVPGFIADQEAGYWIADPTGGWMKTHPESHNKYVNDVNRVHGGDVKGLVRQLKVWKYRRNVPVSSCYLEMRVAKYMAGEKSYVPLWDLYRSLRSIQDANLAAMNDPTGLGSRFMACSSQTSLDSTASKLSMAVSRALKAKDYYYGGNYSASIDQLKLLFDRS